MRIGEALVKEGLITAEELKIALDEQKRIHDRLGDIVLKTGFVTPEKMSSFLAQYFDIPFVKLSNIYKEIKSDVIDIVPVELARRFTAIPIEIKERALVVAIADPLNLAAIDTLRMKTGHKIQCVVALADEISEAIEYCYQHLPRLKKYADSFVELEVASHRTADSDPEVGRFGADDQPVIQYVRSLIVQAMNNRASDIHIQAKQDSAELRFRIDGVLYDIDPPPKAMISAINTRIKILSGLDIAERRLPQDGRFKVKVGKSEVDIRTSTFPTIYGESVVMRLLDTSQPLLGLEHLGFSGDDLEKYKKILNCSYGLILVTGPTGSGKTTTLYTSLNEIKSPETNMITLEDPVEYRLPFLQQSQVNPQIGFDFARGLRSILRQDPDIIMVGEIRDRETAEIAIHAALTGHLVFATLHTNDAAGATVRLFKMGVEPFLITSSLLGVIAQRLIRTICPECKETYKIDQSMLKKLSLTSAELTEFAKGKGCPKCLNSGYKGREAIFELLIPNEGIRNLIVQQASTEEIRHVAQKGGMKTLRQAGIDKLIRKITTPAEVLRVTQATAVEEILGHGI